MSKLPEQIYHDEQHVALLQHAIGCQVDQLQQSRDELMLQLRPLTASEQGLTLYERAWGLIIEPQKPLAQRLSAWRAKRRGAGTTTVAAIKNIVKGFYNGEVEIIELKGQFKAEIWFVSQIGTPPNLQDLKLVIDEIKPAHAEYVYVIVFNDHQLLSQFTHEDLEKYTHEELWDGKIEHNT